MDKESQAITQEIVGRINVAENSFRAWAKGDKEKYTNLTLKLPSTMASFTSGKAVQIVSLMNKHNLMFDRTKQQEQLFML